MTDNLEQQAQRTRTELETPRKSSLPDFDPDLPPSNPQNIAAARARGLVYNTIVQCYVDEDGCLIRDQYGQLIG